MRNTTRRLALTLLAAAAAAAAAGCAPTPADDDDDAARTTFIVRALAEADRDLIITRPALVAGKYARMAASPHDFLRGTARVYYLDLQGLLGGEPVTPGGLADHVQLYGDLHLENIGASFDDEAPGAGMLLDCTDFDATARARFDGEVRRAVTSLAVVLDEGGAGRKTITAAGRALVAGYLEALGLAVEHGAPPPPLRPGGLGAILDKHVAAAGKKRDARDELSSYTVTGPDGPRRFKSRIESKGDFDVVPAPFARALPDMIREYRKVRRGGPGDDARFAIKSAAQRFGTGISSFANLRFWVLIENGPGDGDDLILELKEERDPPQPPARPGRGADPPPPSNAVRVYDGALRLLSSGRMDPDLGYVIWGGVSFQVRRETAGRRNFDVAGFAEALRDDKWAPRDIEDLGRTVGRLAGGGHARGGDPAAILGAIGDPARFIDDTVAQALADRDRVEHDHDLFKKALETSGPLLGIRP